MSDHSELKKAAEAAPDGPWFGPEYAPGTSYVFDVDLGTLLHYESIESEQDVCLRYVALANPAAVLALITEVEGLRAQHGRDSAELRSLCQARDDARKARDQLKADNEALRRDSERLDWLCGQSRPVVEGQTMSNPEGELAGYDWGVFGACGTVREAIDYSMTKGDQP